MERPSTITRTAVRGPRVTLICLSMLVEGMSSSSVNVQVGALDQAFHPSGPELGLVAAAFLVAYAGLLPGAGRLVDVRGRGPVFFAGVTAFALGSLVCAAAGSIWLVVLGRIIQGAGAALTAPAALALITEGLPAGSVRNRAVALYGALGAAGFSAGLVVPGFVVGLMGWRASFLVVLPVVLVVAVAAWPFRGLRGSGDQELDVPGTALLTGVMMLAVLAISGVGSWPIPAVAAAAAGAAVLVLMLVRRGGVAGFPAEVVRSTRVLAPCLALASVFAGAISSYYVLSLALQGGYDHSALEIGLMILPNPVAFALLAGWGARLVSVWGPDRVLVIGMVLIAAALGYLAVVGASAPYIIGLLPTQLAIGAGLALTFPAASIAAVDAAPERHRGTTASLLTTWQNLGGAAGLALVTALAVVPGRGSVTEASPGLATGAVVVLAGAIAVTIMLAGARPAEGGDR